MDDTTTPKTYPVPLGGKDYAFAPLDAEALSRVQIVMAMKADPLVLARAAFNVVSQSVGAEAWAEITTRYADGEFDPQDIMDALMAVAKLQAADAVADGAQ